MTIFDRKTDQNDLKALFQNVLERLDQHQNSELIQRSLTTLLRMTGESLDRLDWKILSASLQDMESGFQVFQGCRHIRKVAIFGSSRLSADSADYQMAKCFAHAITQQGFMVMTGAGGGIMEAGNEGAGAEKSFGLNIQLPFEQSSNPHIAGDPKLINFKYFFTRKLFFLRETDAVAVFAGGFGTQDEAFECLTLSQTGKSPPTPVVLIEPEGSTYWRDWDRYIQTHLIDRDLIAAHDNRLYTITNSVEAACDFIANFYRIYHSSRYVDDRLVIRLNCDISEAALERLSQNYRDILLSGKIEKSLVLPEELNPTQPQPKQGIDEIDDLPRLVFHFNQRDHGRLYELIAEINALEDVDKISCHPALK